MGAGADDRPRRRRAGRGRPRAGARRARRGLDPAALDEARALLDQAAPRSTSTTRPARPPPPGQAGDAEGARAAGWLWPRPRPAAPRRTRRWRPRARPFAAALEHHARAEAAAPEAADHPLGGARALLRLGRLDEAAAAAARARALDPDHARLGRVEHELRRRRGEEPSDGPRVVLEVVGLDAWGEATLERGVLPLQDPAAGPEDAVRDLACALGLVEGAVLARDPTGAPLRLFQVQGDGRCVDLAPLDDPEAVALFTDEFGALWADAV
ncbi:MAG: hypothetical protein M9894_10400 [Planctomycetes bacterium]|nr:hypothetical protein [Planctomycetota bacterium]